MIANLLARFLLPRLRNVEPRTLRKLKSELDSFNARTAQWKAGPVENPSN